MGSDAPATPASTGTGSAAEQGQQGQEPGTEVKGRAGGWRGEGKGSVGDTE